MTGRVIVFLAILVSGAGLAAGCKVAAEEPTVALRTQVDQLTERVNQLTATVASLSTQMGTLATALLPLQGQALATGTHEVLPRPGANVPSGKEPQASATAHTANGRVFLAAPTGPAEFRFLGYLEDSGEPQAFLARGKDLLVVRAGDTLEERYEIVAIDEGGVTIRDGRSQTETAILASKTGRGPS